MLRLVAFAALVAPLAGLKMAPRGLRIRSAPVPRLFAAAESSSAKAEASDGSSGTPGATGVAALPQWDPTTWMAASPFNTAAVRIGSVAATLALVSRAGAATGPWAPFLAFTHLTGHSFWLGSMLYTTFIAGLTMFKNLPRQTFGKLQAKLFPQYFRLGAVCAVVELLTLRTLGLEAAVIKQASAMLVAGLGASLVNLWFLEPMATGVLMQRYEIENKGDKTNPRYKKLGADFGKWHGLSSLVNLVALCAAFGHSWILAKALLL